MQLGRVLGACVEIENDLEVLGSQLLFLYVTIVQYRMYGGGFHQKSFFYNLGEFNIF